eukprot:511076-Prymnesium_polylepis.2
MPPSPSASHCARIESAPPGGSGTCAAASAECGWRGAVGRVARRAGQSALHAPLARRAGQSAHPSRAAAATLAHPISRIMGRQSVRAARLPDFECARELRPVERAALVKVDELESTVHVTVLFVHLLGGPREAALTRHVRRGRACAERALRPTTGRGSSHGSIAGCTPHRVACECVHQLAVPDVAVAVALLREQRGEAARWFRHRPQGECSLNLRSCQRPTAVHI